MHRAASENMLRFLAYPHKGGIEIVSVSSFICVFCNVLSTSTYLRSAWQREDLMGFVFLNDNYLSCTGKAVA